MSRRKVHEEVARALEARIAAGELSPGDRLAAERELMAEFAVGRSAIRAALLLLEQRGFVRLSNGERAQVTSPSPQQIVGELGTAARLLLAQPGGQRSFQDARMLIEVGLARHAALHATPADVAELHALLAANREVMDDRPRFIALDIAFHFKIAEISGNALIIALHGALLDWLTEQRDVSGQAPQAAELAINGHERVFRAIEASDVLAAETAMQEHLDCVARRFWSMRESD
jgi:GntR family transcriptional regulator, sialic acid-inducible nan operon repressor